MTLNTMFYINVHEEEVFESIDDYRDPVPGFCEDIRDEQLKVSIYHDRFLMRPEQVYKIESE